MRPEIDPRLKSKFIDFAKLLERYNQASYSEEYIKENGGEFNNWGNEYTNLLDYSIPAIYFLNTNRVEKAKTIFTKQNEWIRGDEMNELNADPFSYINEWLLDKSKEIRGLSLDNIMEMGRFMDENGPELSENAKAFAQGYITGHPYPNKILDVVYDKNIDSTAINVMINAINEVISELDLDLSLNEVEMDTNKDVRPQKISIMQESMDSNWGTGERDGTMKMWMLEESKTPLRRQTKQYNNLLFTVTKHEFYHVIGAPKNHEVPNCIMQWDPGESRKPCKECLEFVGYYGLGIEEGEEHISWFKK